MTRMTRMSELDIPNVERLNAARQKMQLAWVEYTEKYMENLNQPGREAREAELAAWGAVEDARAEYVCAGGRIGYK